MTEDTERDQAGIRTSDQTADILARVTLHYVPETDLAAALARAEALESQLAGERAVWAETMDTHAHEKRRLIERAEAAEARVMELGRQRDFLLAFGRGIVNWAQHGPACYDRMVRDGHTNCSCSLGPHLAAWERAKEGSDDRG